jgi:hypothetical protein
MKEILRHKLRRGTASAAKIDEADSGNFELTVRSFRAAREQR